MIAAPENFALDGRPPGRVEEPADAAGVAAALAAADAAGAAAVLFGGGTLQTLGNAPRRFDVALSLRRLDRVLEHDARDLTIGVEAGILLDVIAGELAAARQFIPFDAPQPRRATVGGTLAAGWAGPRRAAYGRPRDLLIGTTVALTDGNLVSAGGMVVKNVTGYDMSKLYVGSLGTLGAIVRANFKTLPLPGAQRAALAPLASENIERTIAALERLSVEPVAALIVDGFFDRFPRLRDEETRLLLLFEGSPAAVERATRELRSVLGKCGVPETRLADGAGAAKLLQDAIDTSIEPLPERSITYRSTGRASTAFERAAVGQEIAISGGLGCDYIADVRTGDAILRVAGASGSHALDHVPDVDEQLRRTFGQLAVIAGDRRLRRIVDAWGCEPATLATMRAIKTRFDPRGTLAPGRYVGGI